MAPKIKSNKKPGKQNYPDKKDEYRQYIRLGNTSITVKEFTHAVACKVFLQPLEKQHNIEIDITISYLLRWQHIGYLALFNDWAKTLQIIAFIGPGQKYYKVKI